MFMELTQKLASIRQNYSQHNRNARQNPWFLAFLGLIAIFLIVNLIFVAFAISSNPGLVSDDYYNQGREYEKNVVTRIKARNSLNWTANFEIPDKIQINTPAMVRFSAVDSRGASIIDADVKLIVYRPSDAGADFTKTVPQIAPGLYQTNLTLDLPGTWDLNIKVTQGEAVYHNSHRVFVLPADKS